MRQKLVITFLLYVPRVLQEKWSAIFVGPLVAEKLRIESAVGKKIKIEIFFLFFERQCTGSASGFDKHRIKKPWPYPRLTFEKEMHS